MKKERSNINILVLGDEGVGKSSLISTFVSRHYSEHIPKLLTRVHLPPDPLILSDCTTTIVDTHDGDLALQNALLLSSDNNISIRSDVVVGESTVTAPVSNESPLSSSPTSSSSSTSAVSLNDEKQKSTTSSLLASTIFRNVDAMVLVYDLSKGEEGFHRLENYWLPLIQRCYDGNIPVIIAGNKMDLLLEHQQQQQQQQQSSYSERSRQQIIALLQRFKFVRQSLKCSAKNLLHVDDVFNKAKIAVLYPIKPLYDLARERLTPACKRAFTRIFRVFDLDRDHLWNDNELIAFQQKIWGMNVMLERNVIEWKKALLAQHDSQHGESLLVDDKITFTGFLTIMDIYIRQNKLEVLWTVLWQLGYDDDLDLKIPEAIRSSGWDDLDSNNFDPSVWRLTASEVDFLSSIFYQFKSDDGNLLSSEDMTSIFSVFSTPLPLWSARGKKLLKHCFSLPCMEEDVMTPPASLAGVTFDQEIEGALPSGPVPSPPSISPSGVTISSSPLPSIDTSKNTASCSPLNKPISYLCWMNHWHMLCTISPSRCRTELFYLGHVGDTPETSGDTDSIFVRALVLGNNDTVNRSIINALHNTHHHDAPKHPETTCSVSRLVLPAETNKDKIIHLILTEIPSTSVSEMNSLKQKLNSLLAKQTATGERVYDMAILVFDAADEQSWRYAKEIESKLLTDDMPRIFVGTEAKSELTSPQRIHQDHCRSMDLEDPIIVSLDDPKLDSKPLLRHLVRCTQDRTFRSTPHGERKRRFAALKRRALLFSSVVSVGIVTVYFLKEAKKIERSSWCQFFQRILPI